MDTLEVGTVMNPTPMDTNYKTLRPIGNWTSSQTITGLLKEGTENKPVLITYSSPKN